MHWISPRARAGFSMLAASSEPLAPPAPTIVCISSMKSIMLSFLASSLRMAFILSSNCPRYFVPATIDARSSATTRLLKSTLETFLFVIRRARPSAMADLPTPGSPISTGLFFLRLDSICARRSISRSLPTTGSSLPSSAAFVRSIPKLSSTGVSDELRWACWPPCCGLLGPGLENMPSSSSSRGKSAWAAGLPASTAFLTSE